MWLTANKSQSDTLSTRMNGLAQFKMVGAWRTALGMLPVFLRGTAENQERYVLLNGTKGNFCLDFVGGLDQSSQRQAAWSCDVGHYLTINNDSVIVNRWRGIPPKSVFRVEVFFNGYQNFIAILKRQRRQLPKYRESCLGCVSQDQNCRGQRGNGLRSLRILLHLLASAAAENDGLLVSDLPRWGLTPDVIEYSQTITDATLRPLYNDLSGLGRYDTLQPDFDLVIRHASGAVFQDAHLEAQIPEQRWLEGLEGPAYVDPRSAPSETGVYFTPAALARTLAEEAMRWSPTVAARSFVIFDPACGSGELLKECLRLLKLKDQVHHVRIVGWDKSTAAVEMARFVLAWESRAWLSGQVEIDIDPDALLTEKIGQLMSMCS